MELLLFCVCPHAQGTLWPFNCTFLGISVWGADAVFHIKSEPFKDYFLDLLDNVLLGCVFFFAIASLAFYGGLPDAWIIQIWKIIMFVISGFAVLAVLMAVWYELYGKFWSAKARTMYSGRKVSRFTSLVHRVVLPEVPKEVATSKLTLRSAVNKLGGRGKKLFGSLVNSLQTHAIRHAFTPKNMSSEVLSLCNSVTFSAQDFLDHTNSNCFLSKKPEAVFFRKLVAAFPEVGDSKRFGLTEHTRFMRSLRTGVSDWH